jgi:hypothetical protein
MNPKKIIIFLIVFLTMYSFITYISKLDVLGSLAVIKSKITGKQIENDYENLIIPATKLLPESLDNQSLFKNHWQSDVGYFVLVSKDISSKQGPSQNAAVFRKLLKSQRVRILFENSEETDVDGEFRRWVFLGTESGKTYLGWVLKDELIQAKDFNIYKPQEATRYLFTKGELDGSIDVKRNGRFTFQWKAKGSGLFLKGQDYGQLFSYDDILWAKKDNQDFLYMFFINNNSNELSHEYRFRNDSIKMEMFTMPKEGDD